MEEQQATNEKGRATQIASDYVDSFLIEYVEKGNGFSKNMNEKAGRLDSDNISYRVINHWESQGILSNDRPGGKGWRMYSQMDRIWMEVVVQLRQFGYSLENIRTIRNNLGPSPKDPAQEYPMLELYFALVVMTKEPAYLWAFEDGNHWLLLEREIPIHVMVMGFQPHICISLNQIAKKLYPGKNIKVDFSGTSWLSKQEIQILHALRKEDFDSINIMRSDGKLDRLEIKQRLDPKRSIRDALDEFDFQDLEIKQASGKKVKMQRKVVKKL